MTIAKQRLYRTVDDKVVLEGDPDAAFLLAAEGDEIPEGYSAPRGASAKGDDADDEKAAEKPANKAASKPANK